MAEVITERAAVERPILFAGPMVSAILEERKTKTRRVISLRDWSWPVGNGAPSLILARCPYGVVGDRLWVRETLRPSQSQVVTYAEDGCPAWRHGESVTWPWPKTPLVRTAIFMPRWASRILLEIVEVCAQRLQEISVADCIAEGLSTKLRESEACDDLKSQFQALWDSINEKRGFGWRSNPWVWGITFKRLQL